MPRCWGAGGSELFWGVVFQATLANVSGRCPLEQGYKMLRPLLVGGSPLDAAAQRSRLSPKTLIPPAQSPVMVDFWPLFSCLVGHQTAGKEFRQQPDVIAESGGASPTAMGCELGLTLFHSVIGRP